MTTFYFDITEDKINSMTIEDYEALERAQDGEAKLYRMRPVMCRFMVEENGTPIEYSTALKLTSKLTLVEAKSFMEQFFNMTRERTVPNGNGRQSSLLSEAVVAASVSQPG